MRKKIKPPMDRPLSFRFKNMWVRLYVDPPSYFNREGLLMDKVFAVDKFDPSFNCGHVSSGDNIIRFLIHHKSTHRQVLRVVAHELGHKVEKGFAKNPPDNPRYAKRHEAKAEHYEWFAMTANQLTTIILNYL